ncbi:MAG: response regulator transcription factor [Actinomycetota bacterium]
MTPSASSSVLIVDDDDEIRHALRLLFEFEDFVVVGEARNGVEATPLALRLQPAFVVLDYMMPHMDGAKTAEVLRQIVPDARIVAFSAVLQTKPLWADAYLNKERITEIAPLIRALINSALPRAGSPK